MVVIALVAAPAGAGLAGSAQPGAAASGPRTAFGPLTRVAPASQLWVSRFGPGGSEPFDSANAEVVSPGGTRVFVTAANRGGRPDRGNFDTVAYAASTGKRLWASRYNSADRPAFPRARVVTVSECASHAVVDAEMGGVAAAR